MTKNSISDVRESIKCWIEQCVLELSLCPYAAIPYRQGRVRIAVCESDAEHKILALLKREAQTLRQSTAETSLVVCATGFEDFLEFNDFLDEVEQCLWQDGDDQYFQVVSFHPAYRFAGEALDDPSHFTNRSPLPILQLLRVESVAKAVDAGDTLAIAPRNVSTLRALTPAELKVRFPWSRRD